MSLRALASLLSLSLLTLSACTDGKDTDPAGGDDTDRPRLVDVDGDGYGAETDCDDASAAISPGADEVCNGIDDDCDGLSDEAGAVDGTMYYPDADADGYGDASGGALSCSQPDGSTLDGTDCDDGSASRSPGATESCDGLDNDCDDVVDEEGATGGLAAHPDADGDGYGDPAVSVIVCEFGAGYVSNQDDCDDSDPEIEPAATEVCDDLDNNCDGVTDDDAVDVEIFYLDEDDDGYGVEDSTVYACDTPDGYATRGGDCDDGDRRTSPGSDERCDDEDNDCNGEIDDDPVDADTWYQDTDDDGYGEDGSAVTQCDAPADDYVVLGGDCDEADPDVNPGVTETWYDGLDSDCAGDSDYDQDADGYVLAGLEDPDAPTYDPGTGEIIDDGSETEEGDCDDEDARISPEGRERCNDVDDDCDGEVDDDPTDARRFYTDADSDGYGDDATEIITCDTEIGYVRIGGDCDDTDPDVSPGEDENCDTEDGVDNDCDDSIDECVETSFSGYFIVGKYESEWNCINYFEAYGDSAEVICDACDFSLEITATYLEGALAGSYDECDWTDLEFWEETEEFTTIWGFSYESDFYSYPIAYYYYEAAGDWYPRSYLYYGSSGYGYSYLNWTLFVEYDSTSTVEAGLFFGYPYAY